MHIKQHTLALLEENVKIHLIVIIIKNEKSVDTANSEWFEPINSYETC